MHGDTPDRTPGRPSAPGAGPLALGRRGMRRVASEVKEIVGALLHDEHLVRQEELRNDALDAERRAADEADTTRRRAHGADVSIRQAELAAERASLMAEAQAFAEQARIDRRLASQEAGIDRDLRRQAALAGVREHLLHEAVRRAENQAFRRRDEDRRAAARTEYTAEQARRRAAALANVPSETPGHAEGQKAEDRRPDDWRAPTGPRRSPGSTGGRSRGGR